MADKYLFFLIENLRSYNKALQDFHKDLEEKTDKIVKSKCDVFRKKAGKIMDKHPGLTYSDDKRKLPDEVLYFLKLYSICDVKVHLSQTPKILAWIKWAEINICKKDSRCISESKNDYIKYKEEIESIKRNLKKMQTEAKKLKEKVQRKK